MAEPVITPITQEIVEIAEANWIAFSNNGRYFNRDELLIEEDNYQIETVAFNVKTINNINLQMSIQYLMAADLGDSGEKDGEKTIYGSGKYGSYFQCICGMFIDGANLKIAVEKKDGTDIKEANLNGEQLKEVMRQHADVLNYCKQRYIGFALDFTDYGGDFLDLPIFVKDGKLAYYNMIGTDVAFTSSKLPEGKTPEGAHHKGANNEDENNEEINQENHVGAPHEDVNPEGAILSESGQRGGGRLGVLKSLPPGVTPTQFMDEQIKKFPAPTSEWVIPQPKPLPEIEQIPIQTGGRETRTSRGMHNCGNTCYMNSILQMLNESDDFLKLLNSYRKPNDEQKKKLKPETQAAIQGVEYMLEIFRELNNKETKILDFAFLDKKVDFLRQYMQGSPGKGEQHDVTDALDNIFQKSIDLLTSPTSNLLIGNNPFDYSFTETLKCIAPDGSYFNPGEKNPEISKIILASLKPDGNDLTKVLGNVHDIQDAINNVSSVEDLEYDPNQLFDRCKGREYTALRKSEVINTNSPYAIVALKRSVSGVRTERKITAPIEPSSLVTIGDKSFQLVGVAVHLGGSGGGGHYYYVGYNTDGSIRVKKNDGEIKTNFTDGEKAKLNDEILKGGYLFLYEKADIPATDAPKPLNSGTEHMAVSRRGATPGSTPALPPDLAVGKCVTCTQNSQYGKKHVYTGTVKQINDANSEEFLTLNVLKHETNRYRELIIENEDVGKEKVFNKSGWTFAIIDECPPPTYVKYEEGRCIKIFVKPTVQLSFILLMTAKVLEGDSETSPTLHVEKIDTGEQQTINKADYIIVETTRYECNPPTFDTMLADISNMPNTNNTTLDEIINGIDILMRDSYPKLTTEQTNQLKDELIAKIVTLGYKDVDKQALEESIVFVFPNASLPTKGGRRKRTLRVGRNKKVRTKRRT